MLQTTAKHGGTFILFCFFLNCEAGSFLDMRGKQKKMGRYLYSRLALRPGMYRRDMLGLYT